MNTLTAQAPDAVRGALKPCPFCGAQAKWVEDNGNFDTPFGLVTEHADACFLSGCMMPPEWETIIAAWNTRAIPAPAFDAIPAGQPSRIDAIGTAIRIGIVKGTMAQLCVAAALAKGKEQ